MAALIIEALFAVVFAQACVAYARTRDRLQRAVMLVFSALAALFVLGIATQLWGRPPLLVSALAVGWLLGQPFWTLRLVAQLRHVPRWVMWTAAAGWAGTAAPVVLAGQSLPPALLLLAVLGFVASQVTGAVLLIREARARTGSSRNRLWCAAAATAMFAAAIVVAGAKPAFPQHEKLISSLSLIGALMSGVGYLLAFIPPRWLRRLWSAQTGYHLVRGLLAEPSPDAAPVWQRYADMVRGTAAADAAVVLVPLDGGVEVAISARTAAPVIPAPAPEEVAALLGPARTVDAQAGHSRALVPPLAAELATACGARFVMAVPLDPAPGSGGERGALVLLNQYRSLFEDDDAVLMGELGVQAAILAEHGRLGERLAASAETALAASQAKTDFLANMSHELRTPLNAIIGFSELMGSEGPEDAEIRTVPSDWIRHIHTSGRHLLGLINDILDLSKVEAGRIELYQEAVDLATVVAEAVDTLAPLIDGKQLEITTALPHLTIHADRVRFRQILDNLLSNAIKFTPKGGQIYIAAAKDHDDIQVSVADTGPGIAPEDHPRVFAAFTQVGDQQARHGGTGLGLPLARRLAQAHGGDIHLESEQGRGTRFTITLPGAATRVRQLTEVASPPASGGGILVIEDDPAAALLLCTHLERAGYVVTVAPTGEDGLERARTGQPDIILLDLNLPGIDGQTVLERLKSDRWLRHVPVAIISVDDDREIGLALGAIDYFVKPVNHDALLGWLARHGFLPPLTDRPVNILIIDDDPATLAVAGRALNRDGVRVVDASNGLDGLRLARGHAFDLIICDLMMPGIDGFTVIAALHDDASTRGVPVLVLTSHDLTREERGRLAGKTLDVITKGDDTSGNLQDWLDRITELTSVRQPVPRAALTVSPVAH